MPSLCEDLKTSYEHLTKLTAEFTAKYLAVKDSDDLGEVRTLRKELEVARDALLEQLPLFVVPNAKNPYHEALLEAGLDPSKTKERQEMRVDIRKEIQRQLSVYKEARDSQDRPLPEEWVKNIVENEASIYTEVAKDRAKIIERIKEGMIPVVMPGRDVQERYWEEMLTGLTPIWVENGTKKTLREGFFYDGYKTDATQKMTQTGFFKHIPERPYLVWVKPTQRVDPLTKGKTFDDLQAFYKTLVKNNPNLYDFTDLIPTEYIALQAMATRRIRDEFKELAGPASEPKTISPLDCDTGTRFLSAGLFSDGDAPHAGFTVNLWRVQLRRESPRIPYGFRPAARS